MSIRFLLDTNAASALIGRGPGFRAKAAAVPIASIAISSVTAAEMHYGLAKRPGATAVALAVRDFLALTNILPWNGEVAPHYGTLRAALEAKGVTIAPLDLMIAAHALATDATLVSADKALRRIGIVRLEDWGEDPS